MDGILLPHLTRTAIVGQERTLTTTSIRHNADLPADRFDPPAEVQDLIARRTETEAPPAS